MNGTESAPSFLSMLVQYGQRDTLADHLRACIYSAGSPGVTRMPAERELADLIGVERGTLRSATAPLVDEGLLEPRRGRYGGTWIPDSAPWRPSYQWDAAAEERGREYASVEHLVTRGFAVPAADDTISRAIGHLEDATGVNAVGWADNNLRWRIWCEAGGHGFAMFASRMRMAAIRSHPRMMDSDISGLSLRASSIALTQSPLGDGVLLTDSYISALLST